MNSLLAQRTDEIRGSELHKANVFGITLNCSSFEETLYYLDRYLQNCDQREPLLVLTANVDHILRLRSSSLFSAAYGFADWITIDGMPLLWATRLLGNKTTERVTGIDLLEGLLSLAERKNLSCYFLGATEDALTSCIERVQQLHPRLKIAGCRNGYFSDDLVDSINRTEPDLLFVGMGSPRQELWVAENKQRLRCRLVLPVGGSFDVLAGRVTRAPRVLQQAGLEWAWRLALEPHRLWRRYLLEGPKFLLLTFNELRLHATRGE